MRTDEDTADTLTRSRLLSQGVRGGAGLLVSGGIIAAASETAKAQSPTDNDFAHARLLVALELLALDFYGRALKSGTIGLRLQKYLSQIRAQEKEHYASVAQILSGAGFTAATAADIEFAYPRGTFRGPGSIVKFALELETTMTGAYLGAVDALEADALKVGIARMAAAEAMHAGYLLHVRGKRPFLVFPPVLTIEQASALVEPFIS